jgi:hypothetical protein
MMPQKQSELLWVVVEVASGIPVTVEVYQDEQSARKREQFLRAHIHPENDETGVFEVQIECAVPLASESSSPK